MKCSISENSKLSQISFSRLQRHIHIRTSYKIKTKDSENQVYFLNPLCTAQALQYISIAQVVFLVTLYASQGFCSRQPLQVAN